MIPHAQITPNTFYAPSASQSNPPITIFFISGNPGLIGYYHSFLSLLAETLSSQRDGPRKEINRNGFQIYGRSLGGFDLPMPGGRTCDSEVGPVGKCLDLEEQICFVQRDLERFMESQNGAATATETRTQGRRQVILVGHSVGSYIAMEILRRHRHGHAHRHRPQPQELDEFDILGGIMLFPTVVDIAKSVSGQKLVRLLSFIPHLAIVASVLASLFTFLLPDRLLRGIVGTAMRWPPAEVVDTTVAFLRSRGGVRQAIHMGADEMQTITTDKWTDDIWGIGSDRHRDPGTRVPGLYFYFGQNDHWVAEQTRDDIIALRGGGGGNTPGTSRPKMLVCESGVPHAFCLRHSGVMARKVGEMVRGIVGGT